MSRKTGKVAALLAASGLAIGAFAPAAGAEPPKGQGYFKDVQGGGAGESECAGPHPADLPAGQAKKC
jgi:hypothetical protein